MRPHSSFVGVKEGLQKARGGSPRTVQQVLMPVLHLCLSLVSSQDLPSSSASPQRCASVEGLCHQPLAQRNLETFEEHLTGGRP